MNGNGNNLYKVALRMDDVGACSKRYEVYSDRMGGNCLFLKYIPPFKKWGPYPELTPQEWLDIFNLLEKHGAKLTIAVTASWAESETRLIPFHEKFPEQVAVLRQGLKRGLIEIANHGLTHCVLTDNAFKPRWFSGNRRFHREFCDWIPVETHEEHLRRSKEILRNCFETEVVTFVPPGNVFTEATLDIAACFGLRVVSCNTPPRVRGGQMVVGNERVVAFHDRDIVLNGVDWLQQRLSEHKDKQFCFVRELVDERGAG